MKTFQVPYVYRSPLITAIKNKRRLDDRMKKDYTPSLLDFGGIQIFIARHFGFCYGVENAIDISFRTIEDNPGKRIFLLSEMIHNPRVNADLQSRGVRFLQDTSGKQVIPFEELRQGDIVIVPAFGTTLEIERRLLDAGIEIQQYNTTCPFVEKVWNRSNQISANDYTVIIHGKPSHEETRATFSHAASGGPALVIADMAEARLLAKYITGEKTAELFYDEFPDRFSEGFDASINLQRIGVVNQTTMLASDTQAIADFLKQTIRTKFEAESSEVHFADTRDTLCYATSDNQSAVAGLLEIPADLAIVVGGYNSSNTSHLVELCEQKLPTYFISSEEKIISGGDILHYNIHSGEEILTQGYLPAKVPVKVLLTSGASCPDALVEATIRRLAGYFPGSVTVEEMLSRFESD